MCFWDAIELWTLTRPLQSLALSSISDTPFLRILSNTWRNVSSSWLRAARSSVVTIGTLSILILVDFGGMWTKRLFSLPFPLPFSLLNVDAKKRRKAQINNLVSIWVFFQFIKPNCVASNWFQRKNVHNFTAKKSYTEVMKKKLILLASIWGDRKFLCKCWI